MTKYSKHCLPYRLRLEENEKPETNDFRTMFLYKYIQTEKQKTKDKSQKPKDKRQKTKREA